MISKMNHKRDGKILDFEIMRYGTQRKAKIGFSSNMCNGEREKECRRSDSLLISDREIASYRTVVNRLAK